MAFRRTPPLSYEGTREVLEEIAHGSPDTPERRRMLNLIQEIEAARASRVMEQAPTANPTSYRGEA
jgi:hypothetical protein